MKFSTNIIVLLAMTTALFLSCDIHSRRLISRTENGDASVSQGRVNKTDGTIEFKVDLTYNSHRIRKYDSLQLQVFIGYGQQDLYLGTITDTNLNQEPFQRSISKTFKTKIDSSRTYDDIMVMPIIYKRRSSGKIEKLVIAYVKDFK